jgi:hypothetical protein
MTRVRERLRRGAKAMEWFVVKVIGVHEILIYVAVALTAYGAAQVWRPSGALVPGIVMLWMYLPQRPRFVQPVPTARKDN